MKNNGFYYNVGVTTDKNSFEGAYKSFDEMNNKVSRLIGTMRNAAIVGAALKFSDITYQETRMAEAIGISTDAMDAWKAAASIAGVSSAGLVSSMSKLANVMNLTNQTPNSGLKQYAEQLQMIGLGWSELMDLKPEEAYQKIFEQAHKVVAEGEKTKQEVAAAMNRIVGDDGMNLFVELENRNQTIGDFLAGAAATVYMDDESRKTATEMSRSLNLLKTQIEQVTKYLGVSVGGTVTPYLKGISDWMTSNKGDIKEAIDDLTAVLDLVGEVTTALLGTLYTMISGDVKQLMAGWAKIKDGDFAGGIKTMYLGENFEERVEQRQEENGRSRAANIVIEAAESIPGYKHAVKAANKGIDAVKSLFSNGKEMNDGIMRPDGTITQVAPDDWVFAARNLGDLAQAFIPQGMAAGSNNMAQYSIVQNFTINGAKDLSQTIRQQAYNGTQSALLQSLNRTGQRIQQMSGTR